MAAMNLIWTIVSYLLLAGGTVAVSLWLRSRLTRTRPVAIPQAEHDQRQKDHAPDPTQSPRRGVSICQVYPTKDKTETDVDIIAIHGLDAKSPDTWTWRSSAPDDGVNWLQDSKMLPKVYPTARIFTVNWPASLFKESSLIEMTIPELARNLLLGIQSRPGADEGRPILFIASCLGGVILIQAMVIAARSEKEYVSLWRATGGIVFLATPFRGTAFQDIARAAVPI